MDVGLEGEQSLPAQSLPLYTLSSKNYPHLPPSAASAQFGGNCADEEILVAATKHDPNLFHLNTQQSATGATRKRPNKQQDIKEKWYAV